MAHLYIPLDGVPIVPSPPASDYIAADGWVVFSLSDRSFYAYNLALGVWQQVGGGTIADTNSVDLDDTAGVLTANVRISSDIAPVGSVKATITIQGAPNYGLLAVVAESDIKALFSAGDTDSVDMSYFSGQYSATLKLSANVADAGKQLIALDVQTGAGAGLRAQINNSQITGLFSATDTDSVDLSYSAGAYSGDVRLSANAADAGYKKVDLNVESVMSKGIRAQIADTAIQGALSVQDTDSINLSYASGTISGDVRLSNNLPDAANTRVNLDVQTSGAVGIRAQIQNSAVRGLFSASSPVVYTSATGDFSFNTATTALTAYLLKTGGTMTGQITNSSGFANTGLSTAILQPSTAHNVLNNQATAITFDTSVTQFFRIALSLANHPGIVFECSRHTADIVVLTDVENLFLESDAGTGVYIWKSAVSGVVNIKSRLGSTHNIAVIIERGLVSSATAWA